MTQYDEALAASKFWSPKQC